VNALLNGDVLSHLSVLVSLYYLGKHEPQKLGLFSHVCYILKMTLIWLDISSTFINQF